LVLDVQIPLLESQIHAPEGYLTRPDMLRRFLAVGSRTPHRASCPLG
jgi:ethanolamine ammonia-lyase small subunit